VYHYPAYNGVVGMYMVHQPVEWRNGH